MRERNNMMNKFIGVLSICYVLEDDEWSCGLEDGNEFRWWNYLVGCDREVLNLGNKGKEGIMEMVKEWSKEYDDNKEYGWDESIKEFERELDGLNLDYCMVDVIRWGVEYDDSISVVVSSGRGMGEGIFK